MHDSAFTIAMWIMVILQLICIIWWFIESHFLNLNVKWQKKSIDYYEKEIQRIKENLWASQRTENEQSNKRDECFRKIIKTIINDYPFFKLGNLQKKDEK